MAEPIPVGEQAPGEPLLKIRTTQVVTVNGIMYAEGVLLELPERYALGLIGNGQGIQVVDK